VGKPYDNPWLSIPAADYEGHMGPEGVGQLAVLADLLGQACQELQPRRVLVLGCATGNGFDRVDPKVTDWLTGVDMNPEYLALARTRYAATWCGRLELLGTDIEDLMLPPQSQDLIFAGLIFEYLEPGPLLDRIATWLAPGGACEVVLQLHSAATAMVTPTRFESLRKLAAIMRLVPPESLLSAAEPSGLMAGAPREVPLPQDKRFLVQRLTSPVGDAVIRPARTEADYREARGLFEEYARHLGFDLCFQGFTAELESLPTVYGPPRGCLLLLEVTGKTLGCIGVRMLEPAVGELKRMYLRPAVRGRGLGHRLGEEALRAAKALGYRKIRLDTLARMAPAVGLYRAMGFREIPAYRENPLADVMFMEIDVSGAG